MSNTLFTVHKKSRPMTYVSFGEKWISPKKILSYFVQDCQCQHFRTKSNIRLSALNGSPLNSFRFDDYQRLPVTHGSDLPAQKLVQSCRTIEKISTNAVTESRLQGHLCNIKILLVSDRGIMHVLFYYRYTLSMRPHRKVFNGSSSLFETQRVLRNSIGNAIWLGQFKPLNLDRRFLSSHYFRRFVR